MEMQRTIKRWPSLVWTGPVSPGAKVRSLMMVKVRSPDVKIVLTARSESEGVDEFFFGVLLMYGRGESGKNGSRPWFGFSGMVKTDLGASALAGTPGVGAVNAGPAASTPAAVRMGKRKWRGFISFAVRWV